MKKFSRRNFFKGQLGLLASALTNYSRLAKGDSRSSAESPRRVALAEDPAILRDLQEVDVAIVGSGYGGAVTAARLAGHAGSVVVLERGREWHPQDFPETPGEFLSEAYVSALKKTNHLGLYRLTVGNGVNVISGSGLGGTSLINAGVALRPDARIFDDTRWPSDINYQALEPHYAEAEAMLAVAKTPGGLSRFAKTRVMSAAADANSLPIDVMPLCVNHTVGGETPGTNPMPNAQGVLQTRCTACADCMTGCKFGAKNTIDTNYLPLAKHRGARLFTQTEVDYFTRLPDGRYCIYYERRGHGNGDLAFRGKLIAKTLVLSAGTLGSTQIMMRSEKKGLRLSSALGQHVSGNGDLITMAYNGDNRTEMYGIGMHRRRANQSGECGPTVVSAIRLDGIDGNHPIVIQDLSLPSILSELAKKPWALIYGRHFKVGEPAAKRSLIDLLSKRNSKGALAHSMVAIANGYDRADGKMILDKNGEVSFYWPEASSEAPYPQVIEEMKKLTSEDSAIFKTASDWITLDGLWLKKMRDYLFTAHPLGGCRMAESAEDGVVDSLGRVFDPSKPGTTYSGLYVCDGSIIPTPLGLNPLLTISALAERIAAGIIRSHGYSA